MRAEILATAFLFGTAKAATLDETADLETRAVGFQIVPQQFLDLASDISSTCRQVLQQTVACEEYVAELGVYEYHGSLGDEKLTEAVCAASCKMALTTTRRRAAGACAGTPDLLPGYAILDQIDAVITGWEETCIKDKDTGEYCNDIIDSWDEYDELEEMPEKQLCSYCYGAKLRLMQASEYSVYDETYQAMLKHVNEECNVDSPTTPINEPPQINSTEPGTCYSGNRITTSEGDSCDQLAIANSVSSSDLYYINPNLLNCSAIEPGTDLCLPETCETHTVSSRDETCVDIADEAGTSWMNLVEWNFMLDSRCSNVWSTEPFWGRVICVSVPGGKFEDEFPDSGGGNDGNGDNPGPGNGNSGGEGGTGNGYSNVVVAPPSGGEVAEGTTLSCGYWVQAREGDAGSQGSCARTIVVPGRATPMSLFLEVNPSLGTAVECDGKLKQGLWYCLSPHYGWDSQQPDFGGLLAAARGSRGARPSLLPSAVRVPSAAAPTSTA